MVVKFLRRGWNKFSKLGKGRKKKQVWRRPSGRDNKMREKKKGYPAVVSVGYQTDKKIKGMINEKKPVMVNNLLDLKKIEANNIGVLGKIGNKKKIEIAKEAKEKKIEFSNFNYNKFLKELKRKEKTNESK